MTKLPKRTKSQKIGVSAADLFSSVFAEFCNVIPVPQERDLGVDFICEIMHGEYPTGKLFNIQCKGKEEAKVKSDSITVPNQKSSAPRGGVWKTFCSQTLGFHCKLIFSAPRGGELHPNYY